MSIFALVQLGQKADPAMAGSIDTLSLLMLCFGVLGIAVTVAMALKSKKARPTQPQARAARAPQRHLPA